MDGWLTLTPSVILQRQNEGAILFNVDSGQLYRLNTGAAQWLEAALGRCQEGEAGPGIGSPDAARLLDELTSTGLVQPRLRPEDATSGVGTVS